MAWEGSDVVGEDVIENGFHIGHSDLLWLTVLTMLTSLLLKLLD